MTSATKRLVGALPTATTAGDTGRAMSQENIDRLRAAYEAFNQTGEIVVAHLAPDFELRQASSIIDTAGVFRGPNAFRDVLRELAESFEDFKAEAEKFIEAPTGEIVVVVHVLGRFVREAQLALGRPQDGTEHTVVTEDRGLV